MTSDPLVSIIVPLFNDEEHVAAALESCLRQTSPLFEVICVDDASTDSTVAIVEQYSRRDARIRLFTQSENASAFQARRVGIGAARGEYVLFLDGDDELTSRAVEASLRTAQQSGADIIGFGVKVVTDADPFPGRFEAALQPQFNELRAPDIVRTLLPPGKPANGHLWRYLYRRGLLEAAYEGLPAEAKFYRANDLPIAFLAIAHAESYVSTREQLYLYHFRRGTSGHAIENLEHFEFLASGLRPLDAAEEAVSRLAASLPEPAAVLDSYRSARRYLIGSLLNWCKDITNPELRRVCIERLAEDVGELGVIDAAVGFAPTTLELLSARAATGPRPHHRAPKHILLTTAHLGTGGLQGVLIAHAAALQTQGYRVSVGVMRETEHEMDLPAGVSRVLIGGRNLAERVESWRAACVDLEVDAIMDHHILYNESWPWFALTARALGVPTYGWLHNFALRPVFDGTARIGFLSSHIGILEKVVTLSPTDVAFWKMKGFEDVVYMPNPLSRLAAEALTTSKPRSLNGGRIELVWWGRFDPTTKQVLHLIEVAEDLRRRGQDFVLTLIGPDSASLSARAVLDYASRHNVSEHVRLMGDKTPEELHESLADAHVMVLTSAIEGSPLTLMEAQAMGLPVVMYDLPWIASTRESPAVFTVAQDDRAGIAETIVALANDPQRYATLSGAAIAYARDTADRKVERLVVDLVEGDLDPKFSPPPSVDDATMLLSWMVRFSERNARFMRRTREAKKEGDRARRKLIEIEKGTSFRIGRALTYLPRTARAMIATRLKSTRRRREA